MSPASGPPPESHSPLDEPFEPQGQWATRAPARRVVLRVLAGQAGVTAIAALLWLLGGSLMAGAAAVVGGAIALIPTGYFALRLFGPEPGAAPRRIVRAFFAGQAVKLILTAVLFIIALRWFGGDFLPLITTYAAALATYGLVLLTELRT